MIHKNGLKTAVSLCIYRMQGVGNSAHLTIPVAGINS